MNVVGLLQHILACTQLSAGLIIAFAETLMAAIIVYLPLILKFSSFVARVGRKRSVLKILKFCRELKRNQFFQCSDMFLRRFVAPGSGNPCKHHQLVTEETSNSK